MVFGPGEERDISSSPGFGVLRGRRNRPPSSPSNGRNRWCWSRPQGSWSWVPRAARQPLWSRVQGREFPWPDARRGPVFGSRQRRFCSTKTHLATRLPSEFAITFRRLQIWLRSTHPRAPNAALRTRKNPPEGAAFDRRSNLVCATVPSCVLHACQVSYGSGCLDTARVQ